ncbi:protein-glutamine gamma-glutamyltransferase [Metabacillus herbersteinensis]|uniref:Protein-glutamine gamma-glutamyltransferase n=1 Tax=Metabacillus herbersteinensis TaxID=283816 RepID=A0ABV6GBJ5_9BACI
MIIIQNGYNLQSSSFTDQQNEIIQLMNRYQETYSYTNRSQFLFELKLRMESIQAAEDLYKSGVKFATFATSRCNEKLWTLTSQGGFVIRQGVSPSDAINDIFNNGQLYAFECATSIVIVYYKAVLESIDLNQFNRLYQGMILYDWHFDDDLSIYTRRGNDYLPGDCLYFKNPDFNPKTPQWRGENAIYLGNNLFYGHGIGIKDAAGIIESLSKKRRPGATESPFLLSQVTRLDAKFLYNFSPMDNLRVPAFLQENTIVTRIGSKRMWI